MPSIPSFQCFSCRHINPVGAVFCSDCGKQLTMQPCPQCGALSTRGARNCDKCGASLTPPAAPGRDFLLAQAQVTAPTHKDAGAAISKAARPNPDPGHSWSEPQPLEEPLSAEMGEPSLLWQKHQAGRVNETMLYETGARRRMRVAAAASLLMLGTFVLWVHFYGPPVQLAQKQGKKQTAADLPGAPQLGAATSSTMPAQMNYGLKPTGTLPISAIGAAGLENAPSPASHQVVIELILPPLSATDAEVNTRQDPSIARECPQAVATLGLCNQLTKQENP